MRQILRLYRCLLIIGGLLAGRIAQAQAPAWQTAIAISASGMGSAYSNAVATDAAGNVYIAGQFNGTLSLGILTLTSPTSANNGFITKWSPATQRFVWAQQLGGAATGVAVMGTNVYVTGYFSNTANFGGTTLTSAGDDDIFLAKLTDIGSSGTLAWARQAGGVGLDRAQTVAITSSAIYIAGQFNQTATFGTTTLTGSGSTNAFVAKLTDSGSAGTFTWAQSAGTGSYTNAYGLAAAGSTVYVTGQFSQTAQFGNTTLASTAAYTGYVAKLVDAGATSSFSWAQAPTGTGSTFALGVATTGTNVYVVGKFTGTPAFGSQTLTTAGLNDMYLAKLTDGGGQGTYVWAQRAGGTSDDGGQKVTAISNHIYVSGSFRGTASFGTASLTSTGGSDIFVTEFTDVGPSATFTWTQQAGGPGNDNGLDIALSRAAPVVVGSFNATASFGGQAITNTSSYSENAFLALMASEVLATTPIATPLVVACFPNPVHGAATVCLPVAVEATTLTIFNALGRTVRTQHAASGTNILIDFTGLEPGMYAIRIQVGKATAVQKLVLE